MQDLKEYAATIGERKVVKVIQEKIRGGAYLAHINNDGVIASQMVLPIFICYFIVRSPISILGFYVRLLFHTIEILMEPIQQKGKELL